MGYLTSWLYSPILCHNCLMARGEPVPNEHRVQHGWHGTTAPLDVGDTLHPTAVTGRKTNDALSSSTDTYFYPHVEGSPNYLTRRYAWNYTKKGKGRPRILKTEPVGEQHYNANAEENPEPKYTSRVAPKQRVVDVEWSPPEDHFPWSHEQYKVNTHDTLPHINWNDHGATNYRVFRTDISTGEVAEYDDRLKPVDENAKIAEGHMDRKPTPKKQHMSSQFDQQLPGMEGL